MENQKDLKWMTLVSLGVMFVLLLNYALTGGYALAGGYYWTYDLMEAWSFGLTLVFLFLNVLTISVATLFTSGIRGTGVYRIAIGSFVVSMLFFVLALISAMAKTRVPLIF